MATMENAMEAYAGESQANRKYSAFADQAESEGFKNIARLFKAASEAEAVHAKKLLKAMGKIRTTKENIQGSISGETHEYTEMYPAFVKEAEAEKKSDVALVFTYAMKAEEVHANLYREAMNSLNHNQDMSNRSVILCPVCGNIFLGQAPEKCPICNAVRKVFKTIE
ncbi:MAG TPA: rubrerythrin family protein [Methanoregulaceae archaeon]|nr:rubrerythrin family protein [Methanoregulaceae archaeon]HQA79376.1 rubrerythrin family protein [Methanoregulaceae archaeon]